MTPYTKSELTEVRQMARRDLHMYMDEYRKARRSVNNPNGNNGRALNDCKETRRWARLAARRLQIICYDLQHKRPGEAG